MLRLSFLTADTLLAQLSAHDSHLECKNTLEHFILILEVEHMQTDPFSSPQRLIDRAEAHIGDIERQIEGFFNSKPYTKIVETDPRTGQEVHKIRLTMPFPDSIELVTKEVAGHLRDALDHACFAAAVRFGVKDPQKTGFAFAKDAKGVAGELGSKRLRENPAAIRAVIQSLEPYEGGNELLWGLNSIRNPNTHRFIVPVGQAMTSNISLGRGVVSGNTEIGYSRWNPSRNEVEYMRLGPGSNIQHQVNATFFVVFEGTHALGNQPLIPTLGAIKAEVRRAVLEIKNACP